MQIKVFAFAPMMLIPFLLNAQEKKEEAKFGITVSGFVKTDIYYDSRQSVNIREVHFLLYPENIVCRDEAHSVV
jgi:hypothetical protein